jgi:hypothetical protein
MADRPAWSAKLGLALGSWKDDRADSEARTSTTSNAEPAGGDATPSSEDWSAEARRLLEASIPEIASALADKARRGDPAAARLVLEFLTPRPGGRRLALKLRPIENAEDAAAAINDVMQAVAGGELTLEEAERLARLIKASVDALDLAFFGDGGARRAYRAEWLRRRREGKSIEEERHERMIKEMSDAELEEALRDLRRDAVLSGLYDAAKAGDMEKFVAFREK